MTPPLVTPGPVTVPVVLLGMTRRIPAEVLGPERRLTRAVVRTESPGAKPPVGMVAVRVEVAIPGVRVIVAGAGVRVGVVVEIGVR